MSTGKLLAIDPGYTQSAYVVLRAGAIADKGIVLNRELLARLRTSSGQYDHAVIEMIACYGMAVGREVFESCVWIGRFAEALDYAGVPVSRMERMKVKMHLCHSAKASDSNIRTAMLDRFGPGREKAIGVKSNPGPLYGVVQDLWAALALGITYSDQHGMDFEPAAVARAAPLFEPS